MPPSATLNPCDNEIGAVYEKDGSLWITFKKLITESEKELDSVHSGNTNKIKLPIEFPKYSFFRKKEDMSR